jgi:hypothetical protein
MHLIKILWIPSVRVILGVVVRGRWLGLRGWGVTTWEEAATGRRGGRRREREREKLEPISFLT